MPVKAAFGPDGFAEPGKNIPATLYEFGTIVAASHLPFPELGVSDAAQCDYSPATGQMNRTLVKRRW